MSAAVDWSAVSAIATAVLAGGVVSGFVAWGLRAFVQKEVTDIRKEVKPNNGATLRDSVDRIEDAVNEMKTDNARRHSENRQDISDLRARIGRLESK